jgi:hypothetical protein
MDTLNLSATVHKSIFEQHSEGEACIKFTVQNAASDVLVPINLPVSIATKVANIRRRTTPSQTLKEGSKTLKELRPSTLFWCSKAKKVNSHF